jgi:exodeoxyribonuclease V alpha subunit
MEQLTGVVDRIVFQHPETHFTVARLRIDAARDLRDAISTVVGPLPGVQVGETVRLEGQWAMHSRHGREFRITRCDPLLPSSIDGIRRYLGSGLIKGVGPVMAGRIVEVFGDGALQVIEESPHRLEEVPGISRKRGALIAAAWAEQREIKSLMLFLQSHAVSSALAGRIFRAYGAEALAVVRTDPYRMVQDVRGIGFRTADDLAQRLGLRRDSEARYAAGLKHTLGQATDEGHVYLPTEELLQRGAALLECNVAALEPALRKMLRDRQAIAEDEAVYLTSLFLAERHAARRLAALCGPSPMLLGQGDGQNGRLFEMDDAAGLSAAQRDAIAMALRERLSIITGGPGVGKSTTLRGLAAALARCGVRFCLAAPTGRAAKRLAEATGHPAFTIHRLLQYSPSQNAFTHNEDHPLPYQYVVADEASMLDIVLLYNLLKALGPTAHLLLVGDADQLPSVGPGNVLRDLIASEVVPVARLTELFRQARQSRIITTAHQVNAGILPDLANQHDGDLFFLREEQPQRALDLVCDLVAERLPRHYGFDPQSEIQVISPMHRGAVGVARLNEALQVRLNPQEDHAPAVESGGRRFLVGDRVMQTRNDYDRNVFNGDMGIIRSIDPESGLVTVSFPVGPAPQGYVPSSLAVPRGIPGPMSRIGGRPGDRIAVAKIPAQGNGDRLPRAESGQASLFAVEAPGDEREELVAYSHDMLDDLVHCWAVSVHKAQGSEFPCVVLVLLPQHHLMLQRNLIYTALTRAKRLCVLVGSPRALASAVRATRSSERHTALARRLQEEMQRLHD